MRKKLLIGTSFFIVVIVLIGILNGTSKPQVSGTEIVVSPSPTLTPSPSLTPTPIPLQVFTPQAYIPGSDCFEVSWQKLTKNQAAACVSTGEWRGNGTTASVPIIGKVYGPVKSITVDGKEVTWDENNEVYTRLILETQYGLNKYQVVVEDNSGHKVVKSLYMTVINPNDNNANPSGN